MHRGLRVDDHAADRVALHRRPDAARHPRPAERLPRRAARRAASPRRWARRCAAPSGSPPSCATAARGDAAEPLPSEEHFDAVVRDEAARQRREQPRAGPAWPRPAYPAADRDLAAATLPSTRSRPSPRWSRTSAGTSEAEQDRLRPHPPAARRRPLASGSRTRYWNTGSWIYEPDLGSRQAYARYLRYAWPGTAIVIDDEEPEPRLLELLADLNPLAGGAGLPS